MKLKFFIAGAAIVAGLASAVSCQDLSKDLTALQDKVKSLESTVQSLQQKIDGGAVITSVTPTNSGIVIVLSNGNKYEITNGTNGTNGKDGKDGKDGSVVTIGEDGNWYIDGKDTGLAAQGEDGEDGTPGEYYVPNPETGCFDKYVWVEENGVGAYVKEATEISFLAPGTITAVYDPETGVLTLFNVEGGEGELGIVTIGGTASEVATIELFNYTPYDPTTPTTIETFSYTTVTKNSTFVKDVPGAISFVKGSQVQRPTDVVVVRVTPANYELKKEDIVLVNTAGTVFDQAVCSEVNRHKDVSTKAATTTGLWDIKFELTNFNATAFNNATTKSGKKVLFAVKAGESVTNFDMAFAAATITPLGYDGTTATTKLENNLYLDTDATLVSSISDRNGAGTIYTYQEIDWANNPKDDIILPTSTTATPNTAPAGTRTVGYGNFYNAVIGAPIKIYSKSEEVKALYVRLDTENAVGSGYPDVSEINAWKSYSYTGLDKVVEGKVINISIDSEAAKGDYIGFRVFAVNWNGMLIDPDGCAFYVKVGNPGSDWSGVTTIMSTPADYTAATPHSAFTSVTSTKLATAAYYTFDMDLPTTDSNRRDFSIQVAKSATSPLGTVIAPGADTSPSGDGSGIPATWNIITADKPDFKGVYAVPTLALWQYTDNKEYTGTLKIYDTNDFVLASLKVTFVKKVPQAAPSGFSIKTGQVDANKVYNCFLLPGIYTPATTTTPAAWVQDWTATNQTYGAMPMSYVFNFPSAALAPNYEISVENADEIKIDGNWYYNYVTADGSDNWYIPYELANLDVKVIDNATLHNTYVQYNYGPVSSETVAAVITAGYGDPNTYIDVDSFRTVFHTIYDDNYYSWRWSTMAEQAAAGYPGAVAPNPSATPAVPGSYATGFFTSITYGTPTATLDVKFVKGISSYDSKYSCFLNAPYGTALTPSQPSLTITGVKLYTKNTTLEEYYKATISGTTITFTQQSSSTNPISDVASTLVVTCKDSYNKTVKFELPMTVAKN